jgi:hypothetical protein
LKGILVLLACALAQTSGAAEAPTAYTLQGHVGTSAVRMELDRSDNQLHGSYVYVKIGKPLLLEGSIEDDGAVKLEESHAADFTMGSFKGTLAANGTFSGMWTQPPRFGVPPPPDKILPFSLTPAPPPIPDPGLARFIGHWHRENADIVMVGLGQGRLRGWGEAVGPYTMADGEPSADLGNFQAIATPRGDDIRFNAGGCTIEAKLKNDALLVDSDLGCAGNRATFVGSFSR